jgi:hypothetical protein
MAGSEQDLQPRALLDEVETQASGFPRCRSGSAAARLDVRE